MDAAKSLDGVEPTQTTERRTRILLVDEHAITAEIERKYLVSVGFEVVLATETEQAMAKIAAEPFDLVMIDTSFRGDKGAETLMVLRKKSCNPGVKSLVSGLSFPPPLKKRVREAGADEIFVKPIPRPQMLREIKKLTAQDIRVTERIPHTLHLVLKWEQGVFNCQTLNVSADGLHLSAWSPSANKGFVRQGLGSPAPSEALSRPPIGALVEMDVQLTESEHLTKIQGEVMRHTPEGFGVRFVKLKKSDQKKLDKYILRHSLEHAASHFYL